MKDFEIMIKATFSVNEKAEDELQAMNLATSTVQRRFKAIGFKVEPHQLQLEVLRYNNIPIETI